MKTKIINGDMRYYLAHLEESKVYLTKNQMRITLELIYNLTIEEKE